MRHVFIIGSKGIPAAYGGFEFFVDQLIQHQKEKEIQYHVACMNSEQKEFFYHDAHCFSVQVPQMGSAKAVYYDLAAFQYCLRYIKKHDCKNAIVYVLACRIGPFISMCKRRLRKYDGILFVNPDGHEWMRSKWNAAIKKYWKISERYMVKAADLLICDSKNIEDYIRKEYRNYGPMTTYIAYGTEVYEENSFSDKAKNTYEEWLSKHGVKPGEYYLIVGRFVPENNYEFMISEFMKSTTKKDLVIITNVEKNKLYQQLRNKTKFEHDKRIKFVGTVYNTELLGEIRKGATAYLHGHSVGGTNPSLLGAMAQTQVNLLYDVGFNREVAEETALYFNLENGSLVHAMQRAEALNRDERNEWGKKAKQRIREAFSHEKITSMYEHIFMQERKR